MCMILGNSVRGAGAFIATDTRVQWYDMHRYDTGGKLVDTGNGFATGLGSHNALGVALASLRDAGAVPPGTDPVTRQVDLIARGLRANGFEVFNRPAPPRDPSFLCMMVIELARPDTVTTTNGGYRDSFENDWTMGVPDGLPDEKEKWLWATMRTEFKRAWPGLANRIQLAAKYFHRVSRISSKMSGVMEIGYILPTPAGPVRGYLFGNALEIANTGADEILERFHSDCANRLPDEILGAFDDGKFAPKASDAGGTIIDTSVTESGGIPVNRLLGKALAGDPNSLDGTPEGLTYKRVTVNAVTGGSIDLSLSGFINKHLGNIADGGSRYAAIQPNADNTASNIALGITSIVCSLHDTTTPTIGTGTPTALTWNTEDSDSLGMHAAGSDSVALNVTGGIVIIYATIRWPTSNLLGLRHLQLYKNGSLFQDELVQSRSTANAGEFWQQKTWYDYAPTSGDFYQIVALQDSGSTIAVEGKRFLVLHVRG